MKTKMSFLRPLAAALSLMFAAATHTALAATTATTAPVGFTNLAIPVGTTISVPTMTNPALYAGMAAISLDGLTATPVNAPGWAIAAYAKTSFAIPAPNYPTHYFEVVAGAQEGLVLDVSTNNATSLSLQVAAPVALRGTTVQFVLRHHVTLDTVVNGSTGLSAFVDAVSVYNSDGTQSVRFYDGASFLDQNFTYAAGHTVIHPGQGFVITASNPVTLIYQGNVKTTKTQVNLYAVATNVVGPLSPASSTLFTASSSLAAALAPYQDGLNNFSTNGNMTILAAYYSDGSVILDGNFNPLAPNAPDNIPLNRGFVVSVGTDTIWTVNSPIQ